MHNRAPVVEVVASDEFREWYDSLDEPDSEAVSFLVDLLEIKGFSLGYPYSSAVQGTKEPLRELRAQSRGRPFRVFYAFDPRREAVLLIGGDKSGNNRFYEQYVPRAERIWRDYLVEQKAGKHEEKP